MVWVRRDLQDHLLLTPQPWAGKRWNEQNDLFLFSTWLRLNCNNAMRRLPWFQWAPKWVSTGAVSSADPLDTRPPGGSAHWHATNGSRATLHMAHGPPGTGRWLTEHWSTEGTGKGVWKVALRRTTVAAAGIGWKSDARITGGRTQNGNRHEAGLCSQRKMTYFRVIKRDFFLQLWLFN